MFIPDELQKNVAFVGFRHSGKTDWRGTAFIVGTPSSDQSNAYHYVVTAKHIIVQIQMYAKDQKVLLRINHVDGLVQEYETNVSDWAFHASNLEVDVAIAPVSLGPLIDLKAWPLEVSRNAGVPEWVRVGTEIFYPGLFARHSGKTRNLPVVRTGTIASLPVEPIFVQSLLAEIEAYLIESRSIGGLSGSPVFAYRSTPTGRYAVNYEVFWIGLIHGHFDATGEGSETGELSRRTERLNMGLAIVVPAASVLEVVDQSKFRELRRVP